MKKVFLVLLLALLAVPAFGTDWKHTNTVNLGWDPVTQYEDGTPLPADAIIQYALHTKLLKTGAVNNLPGLLSTTTGSITFQEEGRYYLGVHALRLDQAPGEPSPTIVSESIIAWSDQAEYCKDGKTFGIMYFKGHKMPYGLNSP